jgi:hypothetical protein
MTLGQDRVVLEFLKDSRVPDPHDRVQREVRSRAELSGRRAGSAFVITGGTTVTGQTACSTTAWLTEPRSSSVKPPRPLDPTTRRSAPAESSTSASAGFRSSTTVRRMSTPAGGAVHLVQERLKELLGLVAEGLLELGSIPQRDGHLLRWRFPDRGHDRAR